MQVKFTFEEPEQTWIALACARLLCDIQHLCLFAMYLADKRVLEEFDVFDSHAQEYKYMIEADTDAAPKRLDYFALRLWHFHYHSPPEITGGMGHHHGTGPKFKAIMDALKRIILLEQQRKKAEAEAEFSRQKALAEALKNFEHALQISTQIEDPEQRRQFIENMIWAIKPFIDGSHPDLRDIDIGL